MIPIRALRRLKYFSYQLRKFLIRNVYTKEESLYDRPELIRVKIILSVKSELFKPCDSTHALMCRFLSVTFLDIPITSFTKISKISKITYICYLSKFSHCYFFISLARFYFIFEKIKQILMSSFSFLSVYSKI